MQKPNYALDTPNNYNFIQWASDFAFILTLNIANFNLVNLKKSHYHKL